MAYEVDYQLDAKPVYKLPRRFETFDDAFETAKKLADLQIDHVHHCYTLQFRKVD